MKPPRPPGRGLPSSDIVKPKNKGTARKKRKRKIGGQKGHPRQERRVFEFFCDAINAHLQQETAPSLLPLTAIRERLHEIDLSDFMRLPCRCQPLGLTRGTKSIEWE